MSPSYYRFKTPLLSSASPLFPSCPAKSQQQIQSHCYIRGSASRPRFLGINYHRLYILLLYPPYLAVGILACFPHTRVRSLSSLGFAEHPMTGTVCREGYLKWKRRQKGGIENGIYYKSRPTRIMNDEMKDLIRSFKLLECPFLVSPHPER